MNLFGRGDSGGLPMATTTSRGYRGPDGSGKAVKMDAPIVRGWKNANRYTQYTYYFLVFSVVLLVWSYRCLRYNFGSLNFSCYSSECTLSISAPYTRGTTKIRFPRQHLVKAESVKVTKNGAFVNIDTSLGLRERNTKKGSQNSKFNKGPDDDGNYASYSIHLKPKVLIDPNNQFVDDDGSYNQHAINNIEKDLKDFDKSFDMFTVNEEGNYVLGNLRPYNLGRTRRRTRTQVSKIDSYIRERRHQLSIKETSGLAWQGIVGLVVGIFTFFFTFVVGQFVNEPRQRGPVPRRRTTNSSAPSQRSKQYSSKRSVGTQRVR